MSSDKIVGIDLGTTHSAIAHLDDHGRPEILANAESERITPSVILFDEGGEVVVGRIAKAQAVADPARVVQFIKREMGNAGFRQELAGREWTPEELSALILKKLVADAGARLGAPPRRAVITVPAHFNDAQRKATQDAGRIAGLEVARILDEPTAAALAYGTHHKDRPGTYLVFDLGGGTLDATLMDIGPDGFAVRGTQGDDRLGGKDWDDRIVTHVAARFKEEHGADPLEDPRSYQDLLDKAEAAKIALSHKTRVRIACHHAGRSTQVELTREEFEELTADLLGRCEIKAKCVLEDAGLAPDRLAGVLLSGGSTRMPQVPRMLAATFGLEPETKVNPDEAVALGAALQGALVEIAERRARGEDPGPLGAALGEIAVATVNAHSLGVVARRNGGFENVILIPRNTPLPCERTGFFATLYDNQQFVEINVLEGEASEPESCVKIGRCRITGLPPRRRGAPVVVTYRYDADGRVHVLAQDQETGHEAQAVIEHDHGLAEAAVLEAKERLSAVAVT